ncbi:hypothetical protein ACFL57_00715 [Candidatus Margulisiibacteriota bacterium]
MAEHKLSLGKALIEGIVKLGQVLEYHVEKEFPVDDSTYGEAPAIDVAWFTKKGNRFPLFIFEVESKATNGMTNNPLKVYAQENREFEKPLFFFHVVAQGGASSSRPRNLESQYGKNNYRIYLIGRDNATSLICDVISQHGRVKEDIDYISLHRLLNSDVWSNQVDYAFVLRYAAKLQLSQDNILPSYIHLCREDESLFQDLMSLVYVEFNNGFENSNSFDTYLGSQWLIPIFYAMAIGSVDSKKKVSDWSNKLLDWQNKSSYMPQITPAFGLSQDYDAFMLGCAPQLITLCVAIAKRKGDFCGELALVLLKVIEIIGQHWDGLNTAIYLLHLSARLEMEKEFLAARNYLCKFKEISFEDVLKPPSVMFPMEGEFSDYFPSEGTSEIPKYSEFIELCKSTYSETSRNPAFLALRALDDDSYMREWSADLLTVLWSNDC